MNKPIHQNKDRFKRLYPDKRVVIIDNPKPELDWLFTLEIVRNNMKPRQVWVIDSECLPSNCDKELEHFWSHQEGNNGSLIRFYPHFYDEYPGITEYIRSCNLQDDEVYLRYYW